MKKTIIDKKPVDNKFPKYDEQGNRLPPEELKDLPHPGTVLEKIYANKNSTPNYYKRNK